MLCAGWLCPVGEIGAFIGLSADEWADDTEYGDDDEKQPTDLCHPVAAQSLPCIAAERVRLIRALFSLSLSHVGYVGSSTSE